VFTTRKMSIKSFAFWLFAFSIQVFAFNQTEINPVAPTTQSETAVEKAPEAVADFKQQSQETQLSITTANAWLQPFSASYNLLQKGKKRGSATRILQKLPNNQWQLSISTEAKIFLFKDKREEQSLFEITADQLKPLHYQYHVKNSFSKKQTEEYYDWEKKQLKGHNDNFSWDVPLKSPIADPLNYQILIRKKLIEGQKTGTIEIPVSGKGEVRTRVFKILGEEQLSILGKKISTLILSRKVEDRTTLFWMAPQYQYIPVKIYQEENGEEQATLELQEIHTIAKNP